MTSNRKTRRTARRLFRLCMVDGLVDETRVRTTAARVVEPRRRGSVAILREFLRFVRIDQSEHTARIDSATPLALDLRATIDARLTGLYGSGVRTIFAVDPALIGGMRIQIGSDVYDGTVRTRLATLEAGLEREERP